MAEQDVRDVRALAEDLVEAKIREREARSAHAEADREARKVPSLRAEIERLKNVLDQELKRGKERAEEAGALEQEKRELESRLRDQDELEAECDHLRKQAYEAGEAEKEAEEKAADAQAHVRELQHILKQLESDLQALKAKADHLDYLVDLGVVKGV